MSTNLNQASALQYRKNCITCYLQKYTDLFSKNVRCPLQVIRKPQLSTPSVNVNAPGKKYKSMHVCRDTPWMHSQWPVSWNPGAPGERCRIFHVVHKRPWILFCATVQPLFESFSAGKVLWQGVPQVLYAWCMDMFSSVSFVSASLLDDLVLLD